MCSTGMWRWIWSAWTGSISTATCRTCRSAGRCVSFLTAHLGYPIPSPAIFDKIGTAFRRAVDRFAEDEHIPVVRFTKADRKIEKMRPYLAAQAATGRSGVAAIGVAQEYAPVFTGTKRTGRPNGGRGSPSPRPTGGSPAITSTSGTTTSGRRSSRSAPISPTRSRSGSTATSGPNARPPRPGSGSPSCPTGSPPPTTPPGCRPSATGSAPARSQAFAERWFSILPLPLTDADAAAGYWWELSMRQVEVSRTIVFDRTPPRPRVLRGPGRRQPRHRPPRTGRADLPAPGNAAADPGGRQVFKTKVVTRGVEVTVNAFYKHSRIKQYLKDGRALRIETVINDPYDLGCQRRLHNLPELQTKARAVNRRLLDTERVGQGCVLASPAFERIAHPTTTVDGRRAPALRFGDPRVQALAGALWVSLLAVTGITNKSLRALMTGLLGEHLQHEPGQLRPHPAAPQRR